MVLGTIGYIASLLSSTLVYILAALYFAPDKDAAILLLATLIVLTVLLYVLRAIFSRKTHNLSTLRSRFHLSGAIFQKLRSRYHEIHERRVISGHVARVVAFGFILFYLNNQAIYILGAAAVALIIGMLRVSIKRHTPLDIITGFVLGLGSAYIAINLYPFYAGLF